jgi:hypothetical protein
VPRASLFILVSLSLLGSLHAQIPGTTGEPPVYLSDININVPIANAAKDRYVQLELYSAPVGSRNWVRSDTIAPDKGRFIFRAPGDGAYCWRCAASCPAASASRKISATCAP